jgi:phosphate transport system substrate-binding protein
MKQHSHFAVLTRVVVAAAVLFGSPAFAQTLQGAGTTFPYALYEKWFAEYKKHAPAVKFHYKPVGSANAVDELIQHKADFATTDTPLTDDQLKRASQALGGDILQIPAVLGAIVPVYNIDGVGNEVKFTGAALAGIYLGKITNWNDPIIADANPNISFPNEKIVVVHRSDPNDTSYLWTAYLSHISPDWKSGPGEGMQVKWPTGLAVKGEDGVEDLVDGPKRDYNMEDNLVSAIPNSIGYLQLHYAIENKLPYGDVQNSAGIFVRASESSVIDAASSETHAVPDIFRETLPDESSKTGYPISSFTWFIVPAKMQDPAKAKAMSDFLTWMLKDGQTTAAALHFVQLPDNVVEKALTEAAKIK